MPHRPFVSEQMFDKLRNYVLNYLQTFQTEGNEMATMTEARIQIKLQRLEGFEDQVRVSVLDQGEGVASGKSICVDSEEAARMVGQLYSRSRERGARISLEVATLPSGNAYATTGSLF